MESFSKYPNEQFPIEVDFADLLESSETIIVGSSSLNVFEDNVAETDVSAAMFVAGSLQVDGTKLIGKVKAGTAEQDYNVVFEAVTDGTNTYVCVVKLFVLDQEGS